MSKRELCSEAKYHLVKSYTKKGFRESIEGRNTVRYGKYSEFLGNLILILISPLGILYSLVGILYEQNNYSLVLNMIAIPISCILCLPSALLLDIVVVYLKAKRLFSKED